MCNAHATGHCMSSGTSSLHFSCIHVLMEVFTTLLPEWFGELGFFMLADGGGAMKGQQAYVKHKFDVRGRSFAFSIERAEKSS